MKFLLGALLIFACALSATASVEVPELLPRNSSCSCNATSSSFASDLSLDVIFVVDVSASMDSRSLAQASSLIESIVTALKFDPEFDRANSTNFTSSFLTEFPWPEFVLNSEDFRNGSDYNSTRLFELFGETFFSNSTNATNTREFLELGLNLIDLWSNSTNATNTREFLDVFGSNLFDFWSNSTNATNTREFLEVFGSNLIELWSNSTNATNTREFLEVFGSNIADFWSNSTNGNNTREFLEMGLNFADFWSNSTNATNTREFLEVFGTNLIDFWSNSTNATNTREFLDLGLNLVDLWSNSTNATNTREFLEIFAYNVVDFWSNSTNATNTREFLEMGLNIVDLWSNSTNATNTREFLEVFGSNIIDFWSNSTNGTNTREFLDVFGSNLVDFWSNSTNATNTREFLDFGLNLVDLWSNSTNSSNTREFLELVGPNLIEFFGSNLASFFSNNGTGNNSRFGVIAVSDRAEVYSDLSSFFTGRVNFKQSSALKADIRSGIAEAVEMVSRADLRSSRQVIYVITASDTAEASLNPKYVQIRNLPTPASVFKQAGGTIVITEVKSAHRSLLNLASPGFYNLGFKDEVNVDLQMLCEANCS